MQPHGAKRNEVTFSSSCSVLHSWNFERYARRVAQHQQERRALALHNHLPGALQAQNQESYPQVEGVSDGEGQT